MTLSNWYLFTKIIHPSALPSICLLLLFPCNATIPCSSRGSHFSLIPARLQSSRSHFSEPVNIQEWEEICWRTNKEVDKCSSSPLRKERCNTPRNKRRIKGCFLPLRLLPWDLARRRASALAHLRVCAHIAGSSSGPCSCAGGPSWSG